MPLLLAMLAFGALASAAIKPEPIPDLKPPRPALPPVAEKSHWPWYAGAAALIAAIAAALLLARKKPTPPVSHYRIAADALRALSPADANAVTAIFRRYTCDALPVPGPGQTPDELCAFLAQHPRWTPGHTARFQRMFDPVELAKFAPVPPPPGDPLVAEALSLLGHIENLRAEQSLDVGR